MSGDGIGGCYVLSMDANATGFRVAHFDANGNCTFQNYYQYHAFGYESIFRVERTNSGAAVLLGTDSEVDLVLIDGLGAPVSYHRYIPSEPAGNTGQFRAVGGGRMTNGDFMFAAGYTSLHGEAMFFRTDSTGAVLSAFAFPNTPSPHTFHMFELAITDGAQLTVFGNTDVDGNGASIDTDAIWQLAQPYDGACMIDVTEVASYVVPLDSVMITPETGVLSVSMFAEPTQEQLYPEEPPVGADLCDLLSLGIDGITTAGAGLITLLGGSWIEGTSLRVSVNQPCAIHLYDAAGRLQYASPDAGRNGDGILEVAGRSAGIYTLVARVADGRTQVMRVVLQQP